MTIKNIISINDLLEIGTKNLERLTQLLNAWNDGKLTRIMPELYSEESNNFVSIDLDMNFVYIHSEETGLGYALNHRGYIEYWLKCPNCGRDGYPMSLINNPRCQLCRDYAASFIGKITNKKRE